MKILGLHSRPLESESPRVRSRNLCFNKPSRGLDAPKWRITDLGGHERRWSSQVPSSPMTIILLHSPNLGRQRPRSMGSRRVERGLTWEQAPWPGSFLYSQAPRENVNFHRWKGEGGAQDTSRAKALSFGSKEQV